MYTTLLSGGVASGKSRAASYLSQLGYTVVDLDVLSREALAKGSPLLPKLQEFFGKDIVDSTGTLNRKLLASRVFSTQEAVRRLEELELPEIGRLLQSKLAAIAEGEKAGTSTLVLIEVPVYDRFYGLGIEPSAIDEILYIYAPYELRKVRACARGMSADDFERRAALQSLERLEQDADYTIDNSKSEDILCKALDHWLLRLQERGHIDG